MQPTLTKPRRAGAAAALTSAILSIWERLGPQPKAPTNRMKRRWQEAGIVCKDDGMPLFFAGVGRKSNRRQKLIARWDRRLMRGAALTADRFTGRHVGADRTVPKKLRRRIQKMQAAAA